jgi:hypothetical protein
VWPILSIVVEEREGCYICGTYAFQGFRVRLSRKLREPPPQTSPPPATVPRRKTPAKSYLGRLGDSLSAPPQIFAAEQSASTYFRPSRDRSAPAEAAGTRISIRQPTTGEVHRLGGHLQQRARALVEAGCSCFGIPLTPSESSQPAEASQCAANTAARAPFLRGSAIAPPAALTETTCSTGTPAACRFLIDPRRPDMSPPFARRLPGVQASPRPCAAESPDSPCSPARPAPATYSRRRSCPLLPIPCPYP